MNFPGTFQLDAFQDAVYSWVKTTMEGKINGDRIIWRDQSAPLPRRPCVTLKITDGPRDVARSGNSVFHESGLSTVGVQSVVTVSVQIFGNSKAAPKVNAGQCAYDLNASLMLQSQLLPLRKSGIAVQDRGDVLNITALEETEFEERYQFDVQFGVARNVIDDVGTIENVNATGDVGGHAVPIAVRT